MLFKAFKRPYLVIFVEDFGRNFLADDLSEDGVAAWLGSLGCAFLVAHGAFDLKLNGLDGF